VSRALRAPLLLLAACTLIACGDDDDKGVDLGSGDAAMAHDAATDAAPDATTTPPPPAPDVQDAGHDAGGHKDAGETPVDVEEDAGGPRCSARLCKLMNDACHVAHCDDKSGECVLEARPNGTACGSSTSDLCTQPDTCHAGVCRPNDSSEGTPCGDQGVDCHKNDACDGHGKCIDEGLKKAGTACGDQTTDTDCNALDTCDNQGACQHNFAAADAPCGDRDQLCRNDDKCDGQGQCIDGGAWTTGQCPLGEAAGGACLCGAVVAATTCHPSADVCAGTVCVLGNAQDDTPCGDTDPSDPECDAADSCQGGTCSQNNAAPSVACGDHAQHGACDLPDRCDGAGGCSHNYADILTTCGDAPSECEQEPLCDGAGSCQAALPAVAGTACGSATETDCNHADTCNASGDCQMNLAAVDSACGDPSSSECSEPDTCNAAGVCLAHNLPAGTDCGDQGQLCKVDDQCDANGVCADQGMTETCPLSGIVHAGDGVAAGVTIELIGNGATSTTTDENGLFDLTVPLQQPVVLYVHALPGYWGSLQPTVFTADDATRPLDLGPLYGDADVTGIAASVAGSPPVVDPDKGAVLALFNGNSLTGAESVSSSATSAMPIVQREDGGIVYSSTIMNTQFGAMIFFNANVGTTTLTPSTGCTMSPTVGAQLPIFAHTMTTTSIECN
jgi:hypothetical protein